MFSHIVIGSNDVADQRNSTMPSLPQWALNPVLRTLEAAWLTRTMAAVS
jgi:hypothetical protein